MPGVDDYDALEASLRHEPGNLFPGSLEDGVVGVHPVQVVIEERDSEVLLA